MSISQTLIFSLHLQLAMILLLVVRIVFIKFLVCIPEWIGNCNSLRQLVIVGCPNVTTLPHAISNLTSLHTLRIGESPILLERCKRETGEDWHKIEHIPNLHLEGIEEEEVKKFRLPKLCFN